MENSFFTTDKGKSLLKLILWVIFVIILIFLFRNTSNINDSDEVVKEEIENVFKEYAIMQSELLDLGYTYKYEVNNDTIYVGYVCNKVDTGYKESIEGIIKYQKENDITYKVVLDEKEEIDNLYNDLDIYLDLNKLFTDLKHYMYSTEKIDNKRIITYNKEGYQVSVTTSLDRITNIEIIDNDNTYKLEFMDNKCEK